MIAISITDLTHCFEQLNYSVNASLTEAVVTVTHPKTLESKKKIGITFKKHFFKEKNFTWEVITPLKIVDQYFK